MRLTIAAFGLTVGLCAASVANAGPLDQLSGRWAGWGKLITTSGSSEKLKCATTYKVGAGGANALQKFRCTSQSYRFDAVVNYKARGSKLIGDWRERIYSTGGPLQGKVSGGKIRMTIRSDSFVGRVDISSARCAQTISIQPRGGVEISSIRVELKRC